VDNFKAFRKKVKHIVNNSNYGATTKAEKLAPVGELCGFVRSGKKQAIAKSFYQ
jgi:hypothetical protein